MLTIRIKFVNIKKLKTSSFEGISVRLILGSI